MQPVGAGTGDAVSGQDADATVTKDEVQAAYIGSAGGGSGTPYYRGVAHPFTIAGLGVGGVGVSKIDAQGDVYNMPSVALFPGAYAQGRYGFAIGTMSGAICGCRMNPAW